ncbi:hypothetical protein GCM10022403_054570 [Streptomyces coacervatus]|uniref:Uncharacterized protein n=1 Tax=Streptomyces coacervatus TaxID=647381 RepID=A0ABP7IB53_9ACTN
MRRAAMGLTCAAPLPDALPDPPEESEELQAATPDSAVTTAIERPMRRTVVLFISSPTLMRLLCPHANAGH